MILMRLLKGAKEDIPFLLSPNYCNHGGSNHVNQVNVKNLAAKHSMYDKTFGQLAEDQQIQR